MEDAAGTAAENAYMAAMESGASRGSLSSNRCCIGCHTDMGAPPDMVDTMATAAQDGFDAQLMPE